MSWLGGCYWVMGVLVFIPYPLLLMSWLGGCYWVTDVLVGWVLLGHGGVSVYTLPLVTDVLVGWVLLGH